MSTFEPEEVEETPELSFEQQVEAQFEDEQAPAEETPEEETSGEGTAEEEPADEEPVEPAPAPPAADDFVQLGDRRISAEEARGLANVYDWIQSRPEEFVNYLQVLEGKAQVVPVGQQQAPVPEVDEYEDPALRALREQLAAVTQRQEAFETQQFQERQYQANQEASYVVQKVRGDFQSKYGLSAEEVMALEDTAAVVVAGLRQRRPTIAMSEAATEGLEAAYWANETYREREFVRRTEQAKTDQKRQRKLAGVSGTSGSVPREKPAPRTEEERREAMVAEIAQLMQES